MLTVLTLVPIRHTDFNVLRFNYGHKRTQNQQSNEQESAKLPIRALRDKGRTGKAALCIQRGRSLRKVRIVGRGIISVAAGYNVSSTNL